MDLSKLQMPWEWDWEWTLVALYGLGLFILGIVISVFGLPGVASIVVGGILGACAGGWEWFER